MILQLMLTVFVSSKILLLLVFSVSKILLDLQLSIQLRFLKELVLKLLCVQVIILILLLQFLSMLVLLLSKIFKKAKMALDLMMKKEIQRTTFA